ncbi:MAG TPA: VOC family protein [Caulobacteraceae bacterium]|nr:VOC family protein [Caulobacteraceae bacterium]
MHNLENLKKQAKALVRLHRERSHHLACVARETLPKYEGMSDREVLAADFRLADAQALVARQNGFHSWAALKAWAETPEAPPPAETVSDAPGLLFVVPFLYVSDVRRALAFYQSQLGFEVLQVSGDPPFYAEVRRGGASIGLRLVHRPAIDPQVRASERMLWQASVRVGDAKALYLEFLAAGAEIEQPLQRDAFGPQFFAVRDPDGNVIGFGERGPGAKARDVALGGARS